MFSAKIEEIFVNHQTNTHFTIHLNTVSFNKKVKGYRELKTSFALGILQSSEQAEKSTTKPVFE